MVRSILLARDDFAPDNEAARFAFELAKRNGAYIEMRRLRPTPASLQRLKNPLDLQLLKRIDKRVGEILKLFLDGAVRTTVDFEAHEIDGDPLQRVGLRAVSHDLVVIDAHLLFGAVMKPAVTRERGRGITGGALHAKILVSEAAQAPLLIVFDATRAGAQRDTHRGGSMHSSRIIEPVW